MTNEKLNGSPQPESPIKGIPKLELSQKPQEENPANIFFAKLLEAHQIIGKQDLIIRNLQEVNKALQEKLNNKQERQ